MTARRRDRHTDGRKDRQTGRTKNGLLVISVCKWLLRREGRKNNDRFRMCNHHRSLSASSIEFFSFLRLVFITQMPWSQLEVSSRLTFDYFHIFHISSGPQIYILVDLGFKLLLNYLGNFENVSSKICSNNLWNFDNLNDLV